MNKPHLLPLAVLAACSPLAAQDRLMIAGWDFSQYIADGLTSIDGETYATSLAANYSDLDPNGLGAESAAYGRFHYDGQKGSTQADPSSEALPISLDLSNNLNPGSFGYPFGAAGSFTLLAFEGQRNTTPLSFTVTSGFGGGNGDLVFGATPGGSYSDWGFAFSAKTTQPGTLVIGILFSQDGSNYAPVGTAELTAVDTLHEFNVAGNASQQGYWKMDFSGLGATVNPILDNVSIHASPAAASGTFWPDSPVVGGVWRFTGEGYTGEAGIGYIWDAYWPYVYTNSVKQKDTFEWMWISEQGGGRDGFYAWVYDGAYWIYGIGSVGWYYSWQPGAEGWLPFQW